MPAQKIDFKHIRHNANIEQVISHFGITLHKDGLKEGQYKALCPFHDDTKPSMKVNTDRNIYHCFACDAGGNVLDFVAEHEGVELREAAKAVAEICDISLAPNRSNDRRSTGKQRATTAKSGGAARKSKATRKTARSEKSGDTEPKGASAQAEEELDGVPYNKVLTFELKNLVTDHPFITERKLPPEIIETFGIGIASRGIMKDRLAIPIHNKDGKLVAYCGRYVGNDIPEEEPKYKQPKGFRKEIELYNWHRAIELQTGSMIMVESFFSVFKLHAMGYPCVSPMGRSLSDVQIMLLKEGDVKEVVLLFDGDDPGRQAIIKVGRALLDAGLKVSAPVVPEGFKPHRLSSKKLKRIIKRS